MPTKLLCAAATAAAALTLAVPAVAKAPLYKGGAYAGASKQTDVALYTNKVTFRVDARKRRVTKLSAWAAVLCDDGQRFALKPALSKLSIPISKQGKIKYAYKPRGAEFDFAGTIKGTKASGTYWLFLGDYTDAAGDHGQCSSFENVRWSAKLKK